MYNFANRLRLLRDYLLGRTAPRGLPFHLYLEPTNRCNLRCTMCNRARDPLAPGDMRLPLFRDIVFENRQTLEFVSAFGEGEPLLHPLIYDMIRSAKEAGIAVELSTNATMLNEPGRRALLACLPDFLTLAFDGATPDTYETYRVGARFAEVKENIDRFLELKRHSRTPVKVAVQMVLLPKNQAQAGGFVRMWARSGVDAVRLKQDQFQKSPTSRAGSPASQPRRPCWHLWRGPLLVRHTGAVLPCCHFLEFGDLGNLREQGLGEIWRSARMQELREAHLRGDFEQFEPCACCPAPHPSRPVTLASFLTPMGFSWRMLPRLERLQLRGWRIFERL